MRAGTQTCLAKKPSPLCGCLSYVFVTTCPAHGQVQKVKRRRGKQRERVRSAPGCFFVLHHHVIIHFPAFVTVSLHDDAKAAMTGFLRLIAGGILCTQSKHVVTQYIQGRMSRGEELHLPMGCVAGRG
jgi:hypothetical protein